MIVAYLEQLAGTLSFDRALARCVVREVEDHLGEAIAADPGGDRWETERRAIARFGDARALASEFAAISLARRTRRLGIAVILAILAVLVAMKARLAWYAAVQWSLSEEVRSIARVVVTVDRYAFWSAVALGLAALFSIARYRAHSVIPDVVRRHLRRASFLCAGAAVSLAISVISDGALTALQIGTDVCLGAIIPIVSMAVEIACAGGVIVLIVATARRSARIEAALRIGG